MAANRKRLAELGMAAPLASEVAKQIDNNTATKPEVTALTNLTGAFGTTGNAIVDVTAAFSQSILNDNFRRLEDKVNAIIAALKA